MKVLADKQTDRMLGVHIIGPVRVFLEFLMKKISFQRKKSLFFRKKSLFQ